MKERKEECKLKSNRKIAILITSIIWKNIFHPQQSILNIRMQIKMKEK